MYLSLKTEHASSQLKKREGWDKAWSKLYKDFQRCKVEDKNNTVICVVHVFLVLNFAALKIFLPYVPTSPRPSSSGLSTYPLVISLSYASPINSVLCKLSLQTAQLTFCRLPSLGIHSLHVDLAHFLIWNEIFETHICS